MKNQILEFLEYIGVPVSYIVTAFAGSLLSASQEKKDKQHTFRYTLLRLLTGFCVSVFITPIIVKHGELSIQWGYGMSFVLGNTGAMFLDLIRSLVDNNKDVVINSTKDIIKSWIDKAKPKT